MQELNRLESKGLPFPTAVACSFHCCYTYWQTIRAKRKTFCFPNTGVEIHFYKVLKPRFTSLAEYFTLLYSGWMFQPTEDLREREVFWKRERGRLDRFIDTHSRFYLYYKSDHRYRDQELFLPPKESSEHRAHLFAWDSSPQEATPGDYLAASLFALERYHAFIQSRLFSALQRRTCPGLPPG